MRIAIIDTGTNTFHLLIVEKSENGFKKIFKIKESVKLGEDGITANIISEKPFLRGIKAFKKFKRFCETHQVTKIIATGTAALRMAANADAFIAKVKQETGIEIKIISGDEEALLIWNGVRHALDMGLKKSIIIDIGGGSVEFIIANEAEVFWKQSFNIGAALLIEKFKPADPISDDAIHTIESYLEITLKDLFDACKKYLPETIIGSSGSFDTFAELIVYQFYDFDVLRDKTNYTFKLADYYTVHRQLVNSTEEQRLVMKGMLPMRVDMIVMASVMLNYFIEKMKISEMKLATYALKEGMMYKYFESKS
jgi:exopolyphosphatase/guanosine-5'-triphosphate,3'-diphosphate pyrophosphatase